MTMTQPVVPEAVAAGASALADEQWRGAARVAGRGRRGRGAAPLSSDARGRLARRGPFPRYAAELDGPPREVVGHLRDSARILSERLRGMTPEDPPPLPDFGTDSADRLARYR